MEDVIVTEAPSPEVVLFAVVVKLLTAGFEVIANGVLRVLNCAGVLLDASLTV